MLGKYFPTIFINRWTFLLSSSRLILLLIPHLNEKNFYTSNFTKTPWIRFIYFLFLSCTNFSHVHLKTFQIGSSWLWILWLLFSSRMFCTSLFTYMIATMNFYLVSWKTSLGGFKDILSDSRHNCKVMFAFSVAVLPNNILLNPVLYFETFRIFFGREIMSQKTMLITVFVVCLPKTSTLSPGFYWQKLVCIGHNFRFIQKTCTIILGMGISI